MNIENKILEIKRTNSRWLNLSNSNLNHIPKELGELTSVENLSLGNNQLVDLNFDFSSLPNLKSLDLQNCGLSGIPLSIYNSKSITSLNLSRNKIGIENFKFLPKSLQSIALEEVDLNRFPASIIELPNIRVINLSNNNIESLEVLTSYSKSIFILIVSKNRIVSLPRNCNEINVERLHIQENRIKSLPNSFWQINGLQTLNISNNQIESIPKCQQKTKIHEINFSQNNIKYVDDSLFENSQLRKLNISHNKIENLPTSISQKLDFIELDISHNLLTIFPEIILQTDIVNFKWKGNRFRSEFAKYDSHESFFKTQLENIDKIPIGKLIEESKLITKSLLDEHLEIEKIKDELVVINRSEKVIYEISQYQKFT